MALRIRKDGRILCAVHHPEEKGDTYINDELSYEMTVEHKVLVTDKYHISIHGKWWWAGNVPAGIETE